MPRRKVIAEPEPKRRRRGSGSVSLRADGRWQAQVTRDGRRETTYHASRDEALAYLASLQLRERRLAELAALGRDESFGSYLMRWLESKRTSGIAPGTWDSYSAGVRMAEPLWSVRVADLRPDLFRDLYAAQMRRYAPGTIRTFRSTMRNALDEAVPDLLAVNPARRAKLPRAAPISAGQVFELDDARRYLLALRECVYGVGLELMLTIGLRVGELRGLRWSDLDQRTGRLTVQRSRAHNNREGPPKGRRAREIILLPGLLAALRRHQAAQQPASLYVLQGARPGVPPAGDTLRQHHRDVCARLGLRVIRLHDLRHTAATLMLERNIPAAQVARVLGHSSPVITMQVYAHVLEARRRNAAEVMQDVFYGAETRDPLSDTLSGSGNL